MSLHFRFIHNSNLGALGVSMDVSRRWRQVNPEGQPRPTGLFPHALKGDETSEDAERGAGAEQHRFAGAVHPAEPIALEGELARDEHDEEEQREAHNGWPGIRIIIGLQEFRVSPSAEQADRHA